MRQELSIQGLNTHRITIQTYEKIARFHIISCNEGLNFESFDQNQNNEQLTSTLTSLRECYDAVDKLKSKGEELTHDECYDSPNQAEFKSYLVLMTINKPIEALEYLINLKPELLNEVEIKQAVSII